MRSSSACSRCYRECRGTFFCKVVSGDRDLYPWKAVYMSVIPSEDVPLHHIYPGGVGLRLVVPSAVYDCEQCWWSRVSDPGSTVLRSLDERIVESKLRITRADYLLVDGCEPLIHDWVIELTSRIGSRYPVVVKTCGLVARDRALQIIDHVVGFLAELPDPRSAGVKATTRFYSFLEEVLKNNIIVEVHVLYDGSKLVETIASELASRFKDRIAIHVLPLSDDVADKSYKLVESLRSRAPFTYLYGDTSYTLTSTVCPKCGEVLVKRYGRRVRVLARPLGRVFSQCPKCGSKYFMALSVNRRFRAIHREVVVW